MVVRRWYLMSFLACCACQEGVAPRTHVPPPPPPPRQAARIETASGDGLTVVAGDILEVVARVLATDSQPLSGAFVSFHVISGQGFIFPANVETDSNGLASKRWLIGTRVGVPQTLEARTATGNGDTLRVSFHASVRPGPAVTVEKFAGDTQEAFFGRTLPESLAVRFLDQYGNAVPGQPVFWSVPQGSGSIQPASNLSDANGIARASWTIDTSRGNSAFAIPQNALPYVAFHATGGRILWRHARAAWSWNSPAVGPDGTIYYGARDSVFRAVNPDGTLRWSVKVSGMVDDGGPTIGSNGDLYFGAYPTARLYAFRSNGTLRWAFSTGSPVRGTVALAGDGTIYALSIADGLWAIDPNGAARWVYPLSGASDDSPVIGTDGTIYVPEAMRGRLHAVASDGSRRWVISFPGDTINNDLGTPAIGPDGTVYLLAQDKKLYAIDSSGMVKWAVTVGTATIAAKSAPAIAPDGTVYVAGFGSGLWAVSPGGSVLWNTAAVNPGFSFTTPTLAADGTIYFVDVSGDLYSFDGAGALLWTEPTNGAQTVASPALGPDGTIYFPNTYRGLVAIHATSPLVVGGWPTYQRDPGHSGRAP